MESGMRHQQHQRPRRPDYTRLSKPVIEKKRRARINHSLRQLQQILTTHFHTQRHRKRKLEKADILELAVRQLQEVVLLTSAVTSLAASPAAPCCGLADPRPRLAALPAGAPPSPAKAGGFWRPW
ncbi:transcription factor HES-4-like isoform X2 [Petromyzon marinus]|uniref:Transcription factor HES-2-like isoform X2 n=1 Tax=Petromyzon marinus TaxID=7757 RepID=A0AAJ7UL57_PETMA|nr:transcription factor HES-2-like isoform X2 [Petromyzon marinus]